MSRSRSVRFALVSLAVLAALPAAAATPKPVDQAIALTEDSPFRSIGPRVATLAGGGFFSVWENQNQGLWGRAVAADGVSLGAPQLLVANTPLPSNPGEGWWIHNTSASLAPAVDGGFLLVWTRELAYVEAAVFMFDVTPLRRTVMARRFGPDGRPRGPEWRVDGDTAQLSSVPQVTAAGESRFIAVWQQHHENAGVRARVLGANGQPEGEEVIVAAAGAELPAVAVNAAGDALVAWTAPDADRRGIFARLFDDGLAPVGDAFAVNTVEHLDQRLPRVVAGAAGDFLVAWLSDVGTTTHSRGVAQQVTAAGGLAGGEKAIGGEPETTNLAPNLVALPGGGFVHAWLIWDDWYAVALYAEVLDANGVPTAAPIRISDSRPQGAHQLGLAATADGGFFVAWEGFNGRDRGIRGRAALPDEPVASGTLRRISGAPLVD